MVKANPGFNVFLQGMQGPRSDSADWCHPARVCCKNSQFPEPSHVPPAAAQPLPGIVPHHCGVWGKHTAMLTRAAARHQWLLCQGLLAVPAGTATSGCTQLDPLLSAGTQESCLPQHTNPTQVPREVWEAGSHILPPASSLQPLSFRTSSTACITHASCS